MPVVVQILIQLITALPGIIKAARLVSKELKAYGRDRKKEYRQEAVNIAKNYATGLAANLGEMHKDLQSKTNPTDKI